MIITAGTRAPAFSTNINLLVPSNQQIRSPSDREVKAGHESSISTAEIKCIELTSSMSVFETLKYRE